MANDQKIIITGASGWLGKCTVAYLTKHPDFKNYELVLFSSEDKEFVLDGKKYKSESLLKYDLNTFESGSIVGLVHLAFLTRDKVEVLGKKSYIDINNQIINKLIQILQNLRPVWATTVSSGAAATNSKDVLTNPYGYQKLIEEEEIVKYSKNSGMKFSIGRLWGAMGFEMPVNRNYAVSDFICEALSAKKIKVTAKNEVYRRYVSAYEFMETCILAAVNGSNLVFDSGGEIIEVRELARLISNKNGAIEVESLVPSGEPDLYYPKNESYLKLRENLGLSEPIALDRLIEETISGHKKQLIM